MCDFYHFLNKYPPPPPPPHNIGVYDVFGDDRFGDGTVSAMRRFGDRPKKLRNITRLWCIFFFMSLCQYAFNILNFLFGVICYFTLISRNFMTFVSLAKNAWNGILSPSEREAGGRGVRREGSGGR